MVKRQQPGKVGNEKNAYRGGVTAYASKNNLIAYTIKIYSTIWS